MPLAVGIQSGVYDVTQAGPWLAGLAPARSLQDVGNSIAAWSDSAPVIQAALTYAALKGGTVVIPRGYYKLATTLFVTGGGLIMRGEGNDTWLAVTHNGPAMIIGGTPAVPISGVEVSSFRVTPYPFPSPSAHYNNNVNSIGVVVASAIYCTVEDLEIYGMHTGVYATDLQTPGTGAGIPLQTYFNTFVRVRTDECKYGIRLESTSQGYHHNGTRIISCDFFGSALPKPVPAGPVPGPFSVTPPLSYLGEVGIDIFGAAVGDVWIESSSTTFFAVGVRLIASAGPTGAITYNQDVILQDFISDFCLTTLFVDTVNSVRIDGAYLGVGRSILVDAHAVSITNSLFAGIGGVAPGDLGGQWEFADAVFQQEALLITRCDRVMVSACAFENWWISARLTDARFCAFGTCSFKSEAAVGYRSPTVPGTGPTLTPAVVGISLDNTATGAAPPTTPATSYNSIVGNVFVPPSAIGAPGSATDWAAIWEASGNVGANYIAANATGFPSAANGAGVRPIRINPTGQPSNTTVFQ